MPLAASFGFWVGFKSVRWGRRPPTLPGGGSLFCLRCRFSVGLGEAFLRIFPIFLASLTDSRDATRFLSFERGELLITSVSALNRKEAQQVKSRWPSPIEVFYAWFHCSSSTTLRSGVKPCFGLKGNKPPSAWDIQNLRRCGPQPYHGACCMRLWSGSRAPNVHARMKP